MRLRVVLLLGLIATTFVSPEPAAAAVAWPRFALFGWLAPPPEYTDSLHVGDYARVGFDVMLPAWRDSGRVEDNLRRLDLAHARGMKCMVWDRRLRQVDPSNPATYVYLDSVVAAYRAHPAFLAYYLGDEPTLERIPLLADFFALLAERDPDHPGWNNLPGRLAFPTHQALLDYTRYYVATVHPSLLSNDHYDLWQTGDRGQLVENVRTLAEVARESNLPFWGIIQLVEHWPTRAPTDGELRWQIATWLSWGARGIGWFTYWTPDFDPVYEWRPALVDTAGARTPQYERARRIDREVRVIGEALAGTLWRSTRYAGSVPAYGDPFVPDSAIAGVEGRAAVAAFVDSAGEYRFVANSDSLRPQSIWLRVHATESRRVERLDAESGRWVDTPVCDTGAGPRLELALAPGDFALLRFRPSGTAIDPGSLTPKTLEVWPNPARGQAFFRATGWEATARLVIRDARGRVVRSGAPPPDGMTLCWRGERDPGGLAASGVYFVTVAEGPRRVTRRLQWLPASP